MIVQVESKNVKTAVGGTFHDHYDSKIVNVHRGYPLIQKLWGNKVKYGFKSKNNESFYYLS